MPQCHLRTRGVAGKTPLVLLASLLVVAGLIVLLSTNPFKPKPQTGNPAVPLTVFVAAGVRPPVEEIAAQFESELGVAIRLDAKSSGALLSTIRIADKGDLYIPADDYHMDLARKEGMVREVIPFGQFKLVIAVAPGNPKDINKLEDLFREDVTFALPNDETASGIVAMKALTASGQWDQVKAFRKMEAPTVTEVAMVVQTGSVDAGLVWDAMARQFGLDIVTPAQFTSAVSVMSAGVLTSSKRPTDALRFARYLAAPTRGQVMLKKHHYEGIAGDPWDIEPRILLFAGGLNGVGIRDTVDEFRLREGVTISEEYQGCGVLVSQMKAGSRPDAYFACDVSFSREVTDLFQEFHNVSKTRMVILVPRDNPKGIHGLKDLAQDGIKVGVANPEKSALGALTVKLFEETGIAEAMKDKTRSDAPTADLLVAQLVDSGSLHAAIVYEANCHNVKDRAKIIQIDHPLATATQPIAVSKDTKYPQLMGRLIEAITAAQSRQRFEKVGFEWLWNEEAKKP